MRRHQRQRWLIVIGLLGLSLSFFCSLVKAIFDESMVSAISDDEAHQTSDASLQMQHEPRRQPHNQSTNKGEEEQQCRSLESPEDTHCSVAQQQDEKESSDETTTTTRDAVLSSFLSSPTSGQHLMLVSKHSPHRITLDENVAYRLMQNQAVHNTDINELLYTPHWISPLLSPPPEVWDKLGGAATKQKNKTFSSEDDDDDDLTASSSKEEFVPLLLKSHPGRAIVALSNAATEAGFMMLRQDDYIDLGIGREEDAIQILVLPPEASHHGGEKDMLGRSIMGRRYVLQTKDKFVFIVSSDIGGGAPVTLTALDQPSTDNTDEDEILGDLLATDYYNDDRCHFVINADGTLSPVVRPKLVIGISPLPAVTLVSRASPDRLLFRYADRFWSAPAPVDGVPLELASNPGFAVVPVGKPYRAFKLMTVQELGVGPVEDAVRLFSLDDRVHHQFLLTTKRATENQNDKAMTLVSMDLKLENGVPMRLIQYSEKRQRWLGGILHAMLIDGRNATWIINEEGSISPLNAPSLALGCAHVPNYRHVDEIISAEQRLLAQREATLPSKAATYDLPATLDVAYMIRIMHLVALWFAVGDALFRHLCFLALFIAITILSLVPYSAWVAILILFFFGKNAALTFAVFEITGAIVRRVLRLWKPRNAAEIGQPPPT